MSERPGQQTDIPLAYYASADAMPQEVERRRRRSRDHKRFWLTMLVGIVGPAMLAGFITLGFIYFSKK